MSLTQIRRMTRLKDRISALLLLDELIEALHQDYAIEELEDAKQCGVQLQ